MGDVKIRLDSPFASLFLTALERGEDVASGKRALLTVLARQSLLIKSHPRRVKPPRDLVPLRLDRHP